MALLEAAILGAVQGLTEFLPISSSAHLIIVPQVFGWAEQPLVFDVTLHVATMLAIIVAFRHDLSSIVRGCFAGDRASRRLVAQLAIGTVPAIIVGLLIGDVFDQIRTLPVIAGTLIGWGVLLLVADQLSRKRTAGEVKRVSWPQALLMGVFQAAALVPGTSRSGATMIGGLLTGLDQRTAARFSFLLAIPAIAAAMAKTAWDAVQLNVAIDPTMLIVGFVFSLISSLLALKLLFFVIDKRLLAGFAVYRILLGLAIIVWLAAV